MFRGVIFNCDKLVRRGPGGARRWLEVGPGAPSAVLVYDPRFLDHVASPFHVERPDRLRSIVSNLEMAGLFTDIEQAPPATRPDLKRVHRDSYLESFENLGEGLLDPETAVHPGTFDLALLAAGAVLHGTRFAARTGRPTVSLVRPPGHHAGPDYGGGFCYLNNVAIAAADQVAEGRRGGMLGFESPYRDPITSLVLSSPGYVELVTRSAALSARLCGNRMALALEGGYHLEALGEVITGAVGRLRGQTTRLVLSENLDDKVRGRPAIEATIRAHGPFWNLR